jgi:hypothetical protein
MYRLHIKIKYVCSYYKLWYSPCLVHVSVPDRSLSHILQGRVLHKVVLYILKMAAPGYYQNKYTPVVTLYFAMIFFICNVQCSVCFFWI